MLLEQFLTVLQICVFCYARAPLIFCKLKIKCFSSFNKVFLSIKVYFYQKNSYLFRPKSSANLAFSLYWLISLSLKLFPCFFVAALFPVRRVYHSILIFAIDIYSFFWHDRQAIFPKLIQFFCDIHSTYIPTHIPKHPKMVSGNLKTEGNFNVHTYIHMQHA